MSVRGVRNDGTEKLKLIGLASPLVPKEFELDRRAEPGSSRTLVQKEPLTSTASADEKGAETLEKLLGCPDSHKVVRIKESIYDIELGRHRRALLGAIAVGSTPVIVQQHWMCLCMQDRAVATYGFPVTEPYC